MWPDGQPAEAPVPVHEGPQGAPQDPLPASSGVAVRVEESHGRAPVPGSAGLAAALQPHAEPQQEQQQDQGQQQAEVGAGNNQGPEQPAGGRAISPLAANQAKVSFRQLHEALSSFPCDSAFL